MEMPSNNVILVCVVVIALFAFSIPIPYTAVEVYEERIPYTDTEYYTDREPYTVCAGTSFWTGKCNEWKTEYSKVRKSKTVTKYRTIEKERTVNKQATAYQLLSGQVDYHYKV